MDALAVVQVAKEGLIEQAADLAEKEALRGYGRASSLAAALTVGATLMASADSALCEARRTPRALRRQPTRVLTGAAHPTRPWTRRRCATGPRTRG